MAIDLDTVMSALQLPAGEEAKSGSPALTQPALALASNLRQCIEDFIHNGQHEIEFSDDHFVERMGLILAEMVRSITDADCVYARRLNTDGGLELTGPIRWFTAKTGNPPYLLRKGEGVTSFIIHDDSYNKNVQIVRDLRDEPQNAFEAQIKAAHRAAMNNLDKEANSDAITFLENVRGGVFIPFLLRGKCLGCIVAMRKSPFEAAALETAQAALNSWQDAWAFLGYAGLKLKQKEVSQKQAQSVLKAIPVIKSSATDKMLLRKMGVVLTSPWGMAWHRVFIYMFQHSYPSDALCVMAMGGLSGLTASRMKHCSTISAQGNSTKHYPQFLERHLKSTEDDDFSGDDPLYVLSQGPDYPIRVASSDESLRFFNDLRKGCGLRRLKDEEEFPRAIFSHDRILFPHKRNDCRYIYLMTRQQYPEPLGFMVLDNPHPHFVKLDRNMEITELLCNLFAGYLEGRGLGVAGWYERETLRRSAIDGSQSQLIAITNNILQLAATAPHEFSHDQQ